MDTQNDGLEMVVGSFYFKYGHYFGINSLDF